MICHNCKSEIADDAKFCPKCGAPIGGITTNKVLGMKWYKFVIYVQLVFAFFMQLLSAYLVLSGNSYFEGNRNITQEIYAIVPSLRYVDIFFGIAGIAMAIFSVYVRQKLVNFKLNAANFYLFFLISSLFITIIYNGLVTIVSGSIAFDSIFFVSSLETILLIYFNNIYFKKRKHLFIN